MFPGNQLWGKGAPGDFWYVWGHWRNPLPLTLLIGCLLRAQIVRISPGCRGVGGWGLLWSQTQIISGWIWAGRPWGLRREAEETEKKRIPPEGKHGGARVHFLARGGVARGEVFSSCGEWGLFSSCGVWVSHCGGFSCSRAQALELELSSCVVLA